VLFCGTVYCAAQGGLNVLSLKKIHNWYQMIQREIRKQTVQEFDYEIPIKVMKNLQTTDKVSEMSLIASPPPWNTMTLKASLRQISRM